MTRISIADELFSGCLKCKISRKAIRILFMRQQWIRGLHKGPNIERVNPQLITMFSARGALSFPKMIIAWATVTGRQVKTKTQTINPRVFAGFLSFLILWASPNDNCAI